MNNTVDPLVLCDRAPPHAILHPNQPWLEMCGYTMEEVEGLTNKVLTGAETDPAAIADLLDCVRRRERSVQTLVNYKKGGLRFLNQVTTVPVYDERDEVAAFASMLREVDEGHIGASATGGCDHLWAALTARLDVVGATGGVAPAGARAGGARPAEQPRGGAADMTDTRRSPSQPDLERVPDAVAGYADQCLREVTRRLLVGDVDGAAAATPAGAVRGYTVEALDAAHPSPRAAAGVGAGRHLPRPPPPDAPAPHRPPARHERGGRGGDARRARCDRRRRGGHRLRVWRAREREVHTCAACWGMNE